MSCWRNSSGLKKVERDLELTGSAEHEFIELREAFWSVEEEVQVDGERTDPNAGGGHVLTAAAGLGVPDLKERKGKKIKAFYLRNFIPGRELLFFKVHLKRI